jgi:hypothetical protein
MNDDDEIDDEVDAAVEAQMRKIRYEQQKFLEEKEVFFINKRVKNVDTLNSNKCYIILIEKYK